MFKCILALDKLEYDKKGEWKKGLDKRDRRFCLRLRHNLRMMRWDKCEGSYTPNQTKKENKRL